ncbi:MAG TPA: DUF885 domain-containing protein, partial [Pirellulales bacterium]|nr:DUF885 domain-containing protein [Pirellulales bacterium]
MADVAKSMAAEPDQQLSEFFRDYLDGVFELRPLDATRLGDHRFDDRLDDVSPEAREQFAQLQRRTLAEMPHRIDVNGLTPDGRIDYEIFRDELSRSLWLIENTRPFEDDPRTYLEVINDCTYLLLVQSTLPRAQNIANAVARMKQIPRVVDEAKRELKNPPRVVVETALRQTRGAIAYYDVAIHSMSGGDAAERKTLRDASPPVVAALQEFARFLETELLPRASGEWRIGREKFVKKFALVTDAGVTADETLAAAEAEHDRVVRAMYALARQTWHRYFRNQSPPPDDEVGRRDTILGVLNAIGREHGTAATLVDDGRRTVDGLKEFIRRRDVLRLPDPDRCLVLEMPEFRRGNSGAYLDAALPLDPQGVSIYAISPPPDDWDEAQRQSFLEEYNRHMLDILSIHEAYPGHYVQLAYANRSPSLIRRVLQSGVYAEGWAVYSEQMMLDEGYGDGDSALRLSQLKFYLRTVVNTILDHRMHCTQMTDDEAFALLTEGAFQSAGEARLKII